MLPHPDSQLLEEITPASTEIMNPEAWFWNNPEAIAEVQAGLAQAAAGEVQYLGSFAEYADIDIDD
jgi:hypothetical protein